MLWHLLVSRPWWCGRHGGAAIGTPLVFVRSLMDWVVGPFEPAWASVGPPLLVCGTWGWGADGGAAICTPVVFLGLWRVMGAMVGGLTSFEPAWAN
jgi:hypothetical protein